ncbi:MAG TPA: RNA 2',3'-cyclic phosphodiesterase [Gammaproteobacteria bacterium]|nr:RNA 2',3'-cyclic phosphodiesterase [Gammaproteobacteria bacterium]
MKGADGTRRLFFALWPDADVRKQLAVAARQWTRRPVADANLHLTLQFLGGRTAAELACCREAAGTVQGEAFELQLDYLGGWTKPRVQWLGTSHIPPALLQLVEQLQAALLPCGIDAPTRRYVPHVTLSRKEKNPRVQAGLAPVCWQVEDFVLAESVSTEQGVRYDVLQRWPLSGP